jgi:outer membrane protein assembly factor BamE (lipoprotein component of BamABCDE complex)
LRFEDLKSAKFKENSMKRLLAVVAVLAAVTVLVLAGCSNPEDPMPKDTPVTFTNLTADGSATTTTTKLTLIFNKDITGLSVADITLTAGSTGAIKGTLTKTATGVYQLAVSGITSGGTLSVAVAKSGYNITGGSKTVTVFHYTAPTDINAAFTNLAADGSATVTTTKLTLTFDTDIAGLSAADIALDSGSTGATKGSLTRIGTGVYDLAVAGIKEGGTLSVAVAKSGYNITGGTKTVTVYYYTSSTDITATFTNLTADGSATVTTTKLTLTFDKDITDLNATDIALDGGSTGAGKGSLTKTSTGVYELTVTGITSGGSVTVVVTKSGYTITGGSKTVTVFHYTAPTDINAAFTNLAADGFVTATTTKLTLTFDKDITGLSTADIALDGGSTGASKGSLTRTGTGVYDLAVSGITAGGSVTVSVSKSGYNITDGTKTVTVYHYAGDIPVTLNSVSANGSTTQTTTQLTLNFSAAITGLTAGDITLSGVSGVSKGILSGSNPYYLPISGITSGGTLNVAVAKTGYAVSGSPKTVTVYYYIETPVTFNSVTADGSATQTTTQLTLNLSEAITGLTAADITLSGVSGVSKGTLSGSNPYYLPISGFTSGGALNVAVAKTGYAVSGSPKTVDIYYIAPVTLNSVTANGSATQTTTQLTLNFDAAITGLTAADITLSGVSGVSYVSMSRRPP